MTTPLNSNPSRRYFFDRHPTGTLVAVFCVLLACLLLALEVGLSLWAGTSEGAQPAVQQAQKRFARLRELPPSSSMVFTPTAEYMTDTDSLVRREFRLTTDRDGFIEPSAIHAEPRIKVIFLGGSTTECFFMDPEERFPYRVGRLLEKKLGVPVNTYNGGVSGNHTMHANVILTTKVVPMKPDIVVLMESMNDLGTLLLTGSYWNDNPYRSLIEQAASTAERPKDTIAGGLKIIVRSILPNTAAALGRARAEVARLLTESKTVEAPDEFAAVRGTQIAPERERFIANYKSSLVAFVQTARAWGIRPVFMTQANRITSEPDPVVARAFRKLEEQNGVRYVTYRELYLAFNQTIRDVAGDLGVPLIDLAREIPPTSEFIYDSAHFNAKGSELAAVIIARSLEPILRERKAGPRS